MKLKDVNFDKNNRRWLELTEKEKSKLESIWGKYIEWKFPGKSEILHEDWKEEMRVCFLDGMLSGILGIEDKDNEIKCR